MKQTTRLFSLMMTVFGLLFGAPASYGSHIVGMDLRYQHISGNTYRIILVAYGNCGSAALSTAFWALPTATPQICIYNGSTYDTSINLTVQPPDSGQNITAYVLPYALVDSTQCTNTSYAYPGIMKFVYTGEITLPGTSHFWRFIFSGAMGSTSAGRAAAITNVTSAGSTLTSLTDTLDNTYFNNSNAVLYTEPTPFFVEHILNTYNPSAVDPDGDSLRFYLIPGVNATASCSATPYPAIAYVSGYTAGNPLGSPTFSTSVTFNPANGILTFFPIAGQRDLVDYHIQEYRHDTFAGSFQRELTFTTLYTTGSTPFGGFDGDTLVTSDSFTTTVYKFCEGPQLIVNTNNFVTGSTIVSFFGDGSSRTDTLLPGFLGTGVALINHNYAASGTYTIKQVLYYGSLAVDSLHYTFNFYHCTSLPIRFYVDENSNCMKDSTEPFFPVPALYEIDSNGTPIDTISATGGFNYLAFGNTGDIYAIKAITHFPGVSPSCPSSGIMYDTLGLGIVTPSQLYMGYSCTSTGTSFDLYEDMNVMAGRHQSTGNIWVGNNDCTPEDAVVQLTFSPKYVFVSSTPAPYSVAGNIVTWHLPAVSFTDTPARCHINYHLGITGTYLTTGDTVMTLCVVNPTVGDTDTTNNTIIRCDTVRSSYDPNEMTVSPSGSIPSSTMLQYTINFENTGNDTAYNINVMDTLSDNLDAATLRLVSASAPMNISKYVAGGHNIVKFDFPAINLLDSSHHGSCDGMVEFEVSMLPGLSFGSTVYNHAGIFFDDNPVVMTDTVLDFIGFPTKNTSATLGGMVSIYPNPAHQSLIITATPNITEIKMTNYMGQQVFSLTSGRRQEVINIQSLPTGVYFAEITCSDGTKVVRKVVKE